MRCSDVFKNGGEPLYGSATTGSGYVFIPAPIANWGDDGFNSNWAPTELIEAIKEFSSWGIRSRLFDPHDRLTSTCFAFGNKKVLQHVTKVLSNFDLEVEEESKKQKFFICVHSKRDACCALYGQSAYKKCKALFDEDERIDFYRCSHLGGDRFAGTGVFFPSGNMYGSFGPTSVVNVIQRQLRGEICSENYRGCVFESKAQQIARFAISSLFGQSQYAKKVEVLSEKLPREGENGEIWIRYDNKCFVVQLSEEVFHFASNCKNLKIFGVSERKSLVVREAKQVTDDTLQRDW